MNQKGDEKKTALKLLNKYLKIFIIIKIRR